MTDSLAIAILAAGKGTRMRSSLPKVLHRLSGLTLVENVIASTSLVNPTRKIAIVGYAAEQVKTTLAAVPNLEFAMQTEQLGTGHAVQQVIPSLEGFTGNLLVLNGDVPLLKPETIKNMVETHIERGNAATILTAQIADPTGYGRVFCDDSLIVQEIIEHRDCTDDQRENNRINAGIYCFSWSALMTILPHLKADNDQQEYYLTDVIKDLSPVMAVDASPSEIAGINNRKQMAEAEAVMQKRIKDELLLSGVTLINPESITIDATVTVEPDVIIEPQTNLRGHSVIRTGCRIGPGSLIEDSTIGKNTTVLHSVVTDSEIRPGGRVGPFAHLRGQAQIGENCRIGNFVEVKKSTVGANSNAAHLSYIGDAELGSQVNVGAGTITVNYDGKNKHKTVVGDRAKTGANSCLVAPITIGEDVTIGAGSVLTKDVDPDCLVFTRTPQKSIPGWKPKYLRQES
ncbi:bifunctional UDP-N-acetylglucosamine diphosphorylase/glucosamine-1-phosphate N-acetyltransferase GlmU [cf. Phormidesmis sp. LEGE 11477]|uniref:bifunctional UDP-N-acetylglucosamine diphosphorylase/glucosamine-1-phosphate N-acetyltransferase GlmU n=1 Tax=cf. Phormidesmis sp. LEGE 11477 TaxID=1828680 RepID=UPI001880D41F|nr:bifunctional UDP-N-acetylglucosamine diphosphorylase/glucosamine-1-phosphate N-acetyltransferase GlmU [cf. Phormidesmis sp. LEGE 11477]MBE9061734.1 bifunctional UDP-N-acetylglucosamine diphosphorylase/glucosamine-1-phosphate N-acetyltransferase GlmU [cf. Phormidesmis sp. LEGE 11477]